MFINNINMAEFPGGPVVRTPCFDYWDPGSIPGQGTKILQALSKEKKQNQMVYQSDVLMKSLLCLRRLLLLFSHCVWLFWDPWTIALQTSLSMGFPSKNIRVDCHCLLQAIFPTQGSNSHLLRWQADSLPLSHLRSPSWQITSYLKLCKYLKILYFSSKTAF